MKKTLLFVSVSLLSFNSIKAQVVNKNPEETIQQSVANATHHVVYDIQNKKAEDSNGDGYIDKVSFTVTWLYTDPLEHPLIAYIVSVRTILGTEIIHFQNSKIGGGGAYGSKNYSIKLDSPLGSYESGALNYSIIGSDGSYTR